MLSSISTAPNMRASQWKPWWRTRLAVLSSWPICPTVRRSLSCLDSGWLMWFTLCLAVSLPCGSRKRYRRGTRRWRSNRTSWSTWTPQLPQPLSLPIKSVVSRYCLDTFILAAMNGRGYHLLKVGSKRRKTRAELDEIAASANSTKVKPSELERKLERMEVDLEKARMQA